MLILTKKITVFSLLFFTFTCSINTNAHETIFKDLDSFKFNTLNTSHKLYIPSQNFFKNVSGRPLISILWGMGKKDTYTTNYEFKRLWPFINFASSIGYEVKVNTQALVEDYRNAIQDDQTYILIISAHGGEDGYFADYESKAIPHNVFNNASKNLRQIVWATCHGADMIANYKVPKRIKIRAWRGEIDSFDMFKFINSNNWEWLEDVINGDVAEE